jgi:hypothetical protein
MPTRRDGLRHHARRHLGLESAGVAATPVVLYFLLRAEPYSRQNGIDPFIYLGYSFDQKNLIDRYGPTYYGVRFALLLPINVTAHLFGAVGGYFVLRYLLALFAGGAIYLLFRRTHGRGTAALGFVLLLTSPMFLRALMTSYSDTTGVPYLTGALVLLIWSGLAPPGRYRPAQILGAGLLLGLAVHSNPFNVGLGFVLVAAFCCTELTRRRARLVIDLAVIAAAVLFVTLVGALYYAWRFDTGNILKPSIDAVNTYSGKNGQLFRAPDYAWLRFRFHLYIAPLTLVCWLILRVRSRRAITRGEATAMLALGSTYLFFAGYEFVLGSSALETYYYTSYMTGPMVIAMTFTIVAAIERRHDRERIAAALAVAVVVLPLVRNVAWRGFEFSFWPGVPILLAIGLTAMLAAVLRRSTAKSRTAWTASFAIVVLNAAFLLGAPRNPELSEGRTFRYDPHYDSAYGNNDRSGLDWYKLTYDLVQQTPDLETAEGHVLFWFPDGNSLINSIQSAYLWRASTLMSTGPGMPFLDDWRLSRLQEQRARWLIALGGSRAEVDAGIDALRARSVVIVATDNFVLKSGGAVVYGTTITLNPPPR